jgi:hypothetical protein
MDSASLVFRMQQSAARLIDRRYYLHTAATVGRDELGLLATTWLCSQQSNDANQTLRPILA